MNTTALTPVFLKNTIDSMVAKDELPLPSNVSASAFKNAAMVALTDNPKLAQCDPASVFKALRKLAGMGLVPDGHEAALVPFNTKVGNSYVNLCQAMPMVAGLIKRARNSGEISSLWAQVVLENEELKVWVDDGMQKFTHDYDPLSRSGEVRGAYAVAKLKDGTIEFEPMARDEIDKIRAVSKSKDGPAWRNWFTEMAKKSVIRRLCKRLPMSTDDRARIIESDSDTIGNLRDVTPLSIQEKINAANKPEPIAKVEDVIEGEDTGPNPENGFPGSDAWQAGMAAHKDDGDPLDNPEKGQEADDWIGGFSFAYDRADEEKSA